jgi:hypothetical protein
MRARAVALVLGAVAAAFLLASAGGGLAMQLGPEEAVAVIPAVDVDRATIQKRVEARRAELRSQTLPRLVKPGNQQALERYLRRHTDIDLSRAVFQRGARNYAGPDCPGAAWNCTTARHVVQISSDDDDGDDDDNGGGGGNTFRCTNDPLATTTCSVTQIGISGTNSAECVQRTNDMAVVVLSCTITQTNVNGSNTARIEQDANHSSADGVQNVTENAVLTQTTVNGNNRAVVVQDVDLVMSGMLSQKQDAHQRAELDMFITGSGDNTADVNQTQDLDAHSTATIVDQLQNTDSVSVADCAGEEPVAPNSCASVLMDTNDGDNLLDLDQRNDLDITVAGAGGDDDDDGDDDNGGDDNGDDGGDDDNGGSSTITGFQQQGSCLHAAPCTIGEEADGGTEAGIDMFTDSGSTNSHMTGSAIQDMPDSLPLVIQRQLADPWCCFSTDFVGDEVRSEIDLLVDQDAGENAYQAGENGVGCIAVVGNCIAEMVISNNDGTFRAEGSGPVLFANQDCRYFPPEEEGPPTITQAPECAEVVFTTTTGTDTEILTDPPPIP